MYNGVVTPRSMSSKSSPYPWDVTTRIDNIMYSGGNLKSQKVEDLNLLVKYFVNIFILDIGD
jgi:hypothetical protein